LNNSIGTDIDVLNESGSADPVSWDYQTSLGIGSTWTLYHKNFFNSLEQADLAIEKNEITDKQYKENFHNTVLLNFYNLIALEAEKTIQENQVNANRLTFENNTTRFKQGTLKKLDLIQSEITLKESENTLKNHNNLYQQNLRQFKILIGYSLDQDIQLQGSLESLDITQKNFPNFKEEDYDFLLVKNSLEMSRLNYEKNTVNQWIPDINIGLAASMPLVNLRYDSIQSEFQTEYLNSWRFEGFVNFRWNLMDFLPISNKGVQAKNSEINYENTQNIYQEHYNNHLLDYEKNKEAFLDKKESFLLQKELQSLLAEQLEEVQLSYRRGYSSYEDLVKAQNDFEKIKVQNIQMQYQLLSLYLEEGGEL